jgi:hypothetical protein
LTTLEERLAEYRKWLADEELLRLAHDKEVSSGRLREMFIHQYDEANKILKTFDSLILSKLKEATG